MDTLLNQLDDNLKELYRKTVDADALLDQLQQQGQAKHQRIFADNTVFQASSNRFMPYLAETAEQISAIRLSQQFNTATLQRVVKQLQLLHKTLADFRIATKAS
ncbi:prephenate dehydrogenase [Rheinheimera sp. WS51]|uniref:prephenate dehydrogenase n=1 Tax=Rheinheimera sp. WS51 TaxID=3425886 RepID=UPI003D920335